jgi:hypothetical protein
VNTVLWLDGLERFEPALSDGVLDRLTGVPDPPAIVATMRAEEYEVLLASSGPAARAVGARARVLTMARDLDAAEASAAAGAYPGIDLAQGIGRALALGGRDDLDPVPPPVPPPSSAPADIPGHRQDGLLMGSGALAVGGVAVVALVSLTAGFSEPTLGERIDRIVSDATGLNRTATMNSAADFHGTGDDSRVFAFHDTRVAPGGGAPRPPVSDELRIYDRSGNGLRQRLRFRPREPGWVFSFRYLGDIDGDGDAELIGGYGDPRDASQAQIPFMVDWGGGRYRITALVAKPPEPIGATRPSAAPLLAAYRRPVTLTDGSLRLAGYRVQDFAVTKPARIVTGVVLKARTFSLPGTIELQGNILRTQGGPPSTRPCRLAHPRSPRVVWETGRRLDSQIFDEWTSLTTAQACTPAPAA